MRRLYKEKEFSSDVIRMNIKLQGWLMMWWQYGNAMLRPDDYVVLSYYQLSHHNLLCPVYSFTTSRLPQH